MTIIILIILAAVTIKSFWDSKFINTAMNGTINYAKAQGDEVDMLQNMSDRLDKTLNKIGNMNIGGTGGNEGLTSPSTISVSNITTTSMSVSGELASPDYVEKARLEYKKTADGNWSSAELTYSNNTMWTSELTGLIPATSYDLRIVVTNPSGLSAYETISQMTNEEIMYSWERYQADYYDNSLSITDDTMTEYDVTFYYQTGFYASKERVVSKTEGILLTDPEFREVKDLEGYHIRGDNIVTINGKSVYNTVIYINRVAQVDDTHYRLYGFQYVHNSGGPLTLRGQYVDTVQSTNQNAYPSDGISGSYWYVKQ